MFSYVAAAIGYVGHVGWIPAVGWLVKRSGAICNAGQRSCGLTQVSSDETNSVCAPIFWGYFVAKNGSDICFLFSFGNEGHIHSRLKGALFIIFKKNN